MVEENIESEVDENSGGYSVDWDKYRTDGNGGGSSEGNGRENAVRLEEQPELVAGKPEVEPELSRVQAEDVESGRAWLRGGGDRAIPRLLRSAFRRWFPEFGLQEEEAATIGHDLSACLSDWMPERFAALFSGNSPNHHCTNLLMNGWDVVDRRFSDDWVSPVPAGGGDV